MTQVSVIDIGTVTARLAIAEVEEGRVANLSKWSTIVNLGEGVDQTGLLREDAQARLLEALDGYLPRIRERGVDVTCCTLTSAARDASNSDDLLSRLTERGLCAQVIPGEVEGMLTFLGVAQDFPGKRIMVADNGGGSTELAVGSLVDGGLRMEWVRSINVGCRRMTEKFLDRTDPPSQTALHEAHAFARSEFAPFVPWSVPAAESSQVATAPGLGRSDQPEFLVLTGGTATTLVAIEKGLDPYDSSQVHLADLPRARVQAQEHLLAGMTVAERADLPGIQAKRAPVILGGVIAINELMGETGFLSMRVSESDLLAGMSITCAAVVEGKGSPVGWTPTLASVLG